MQAAAEEQQNQIPATNVIGLLLTFLVAFFSDSRVYKDRDFLLSGFYL